MRHAAVRRFLAISICCAALAGCGTGADGAGDDGATTGHDGADTTASWSYRDSTGAVVELDAPPSVVVAETTIAAGLWELGVPPEATFGELRTPAGEPSPAIGLANPDDFTSLGEAYGQINLEQLAALDPDVIVAPSWKDGTYWGIEDETVEQVRAIAPIIGVAVTGRPIDEVLDEIDDLAIALGADPASDQVAAARDAFADASQRLSEVAAANPTLRVLAASGTPDQFYVAVPEDYPDLSYFESLGVGMITPDTDEPFWQTLSWEEVDRYAADVILGDARGGTPEQIVAQMPPNARDLPAVAADQLGSWQIPLGLGHGAVADAIDDVAAALEQARVLSP